MRRIWLVLVIISVLATYCSALAQESPIPLTVYVQDRSEGLDAVRDVEKLIDDATAGGSGANRIVPTVINVVNPASEARMAAHLKSLFRTDLTGIFPVAVLGSGSNVTVKAGYGAVESILERVQALSSGLIAQNQYSDDPADIKPGDSVIVYFFKNDCPYCAEIRPLMLGLPDVITLPDGTQSDVRVIWLNKNRVEDNAVVSKYYELLEIESARQFVPMVIIGDKSLYLFEEIVPNLMTELLGGAALNTPLAPLQLG